jgi:prophage regulatory protein
MQERLVRLNDLIPKPNTGKEPLIPISRSKWWAGVKQGIYPKPVKLGQRITAWRLSEVEELLQDGVECNKKRKKKEDNHE